MTIEATSRVDALRVYVETIERELVGLDPRDAVIGLGAVAGHLRKLLETPLDGGEPQATPVVAQMRDLALWSARGRECVELPALVGLLAAEVVAMSVEAGRTREQYMRTMGQVWDTVSVELESAAREERAEVAHAAGEWTSADLGDHG